MQRATSYPSTYDSDQSEVPSIVHEVLRSPGQPLAAVTRAFMEPRFGHDFSQVQVHTDTRAAQSASSVNAQAYTVGEHIVFNAGQFRPNSCAGDQLIAHELTHVLQQGDGAPAGGRLKLGPVDDPYEAQADRFASACAPREEPVTGLAAPSLQRACGSREILPAASCTRLSGDVFGETFHFVVNCDDFQPGEEPRLRSLGRYIASTAPRDTIEIHGFASEEGERELNDNLSCARAEIASGILLRAGVQPAQIRGLYMHGATPGAREERRSVVINRTPAAPPTSAPPPAAPSYARNRQLACVMRQGGCPNTRAGGLPTTDEIDRYNEACRRESGYTGPAITPTSEECTTPVGPLQPPDTSPVVVTAIDDIDFVGTMESATTIGETNFTDLTSMVNNILEGLGTHPMQRLNIQVHGSPTAAYIGATEITVANFATHSPTLQRLRGHFAPGAFVHLRACLVGQNQPLLRLFAQALGVTVYAGTGLQRNVLVPFNEGDYVRCDAGGVCATPVPRP